MPNTLQDLKAVEVSLVPKGANKKKFLILKNEESEEDMETNLQEILKELLENELDNEQEVEEVLKQKKLSPKAVNAVKGALRMLNAFKGELPKDILSTMASLAGYGAMKQNPMEEEKKPYGYKYGEKKMKKEDLEGLEIPKEIKATLQTLWKENEDMVKKAEVLEAMVKKQEDEKLTEKYVAVAKSFKSLAIKPEEFGAVLKEIAQKAPDSISMIEEVLKGADEAVTQGGIFKEVGSSARGTANAMDKIEKKAEEIMVNQKISKAEAITKALEEDPNLYNEYLKEKEGK